MRPALHVLLSLLASLCGCARADDTDDDTAAGDTTESPTADPACDAAVPLTWDTFGEGFLLEACNGCHAADAPDRHDAPADVTFDTAAQAWAWRDRILARATGAAPTMPPQGGVTDDDRTRLYWWLGCGVAGS